MESVKQLRVGLVGAGAIAKIAELPALSAAPGVTIGGVVTLHPEATARCIERWPVERGYDTFEAMIDGANLDALFVLTPKQIHVPFVQRALEHGLDVFCEKPLATSLDDARRLAELADEHNRILMVGFNRRYSEVYASAHARLSGEKVRFAVAQKNRAGSEYRATLENAIHMVDLLRWFCGEAAEVTAHTVAPDAYAEDGTAALVRFESGAVATLMAARCAGEWDERLDLYGEGTTVRVAAPDWMEVVENGRTTRIEMRPRAFGWADVNRTMGFGPEVDHFLNAVRTRSPVLTDGHEAVRSQALVERVLQAAGLPLQDREDHGAR